MSAIASYCSWGGDPSAKDRCERILRGLRPYGAGKPACWQSGGVALGCDLRTLVPEDAFDRQPLTGGGGRYTLVADLRLDNREEMSAALGLGLRAASLSDSALLMQALERWDLGAIDRISGVFAFVLWDAQHRRMHLGRDPIGQRPLYFYQGPGSLAVASMPRGLHALPEVPFAVDEERVAETLVPLIEPTERTFYSEIRSVLPGHIYTFAAGTLTRTQYWRPEEIVPQRQTREQSAEALRDAFDRAVQAQLRGAGDVMTQLSSGMDSTLVTATAALQLAGSGRRQIAVTAAPYVGFAGGGQPIRSSDESAMASQTAALYPEIEHLIIRPPLRVSPLDDAMPDEALIGRPKGNLCNLTWITEIYQLAQRRGISVILDGVPGNVTVSHTGMDVPMALARQGHLWHAARETLALVRKHRIRPRGAVALAASEWLPLKAWRWLDSRVRLDLGEESYGAVHPDWLLRGRLLQRLDEFQGATQAEGVPRRLATLRIISEIGPMRKANLAVWGVDERSPMADRRVMEVSFSIPPEHFLENGQICAVHQRAFGDRLPPSLYAVRPRGLQAADWLDRLQADPAHQHAEFVAMQCSPLTQNLIDLSRIGKYFKDLPEETKPTPLASARYRINLLRAVAMSRFLRSVEAGRPTIS